MHSYALSCSLPSFMLFMLMLIVLILLIFILFTVHFTPELFLS